MVVSIKVGDLLKGSYGAPLEGFQVPFGLI